MKAGDVVIIRYEGPRRPGMRETLAPTSAIAGAGLSESVALITDGQLQRGTRGLALVMSLRRRRWADPCRP